LLGVIYIFKFIIFLNFSEDIKNGEDDLVTFEVDYSKEDPCDVCDRLWDMA